MSPHPGLVNAFIQRGGTWITINIQTMQHFNFYFLPSMLLLLFHIFRWFFLLNAKCILLCSGKYEERLNEEWKKVYLCHRRPFSPSKPTTHNIIRIITIIILILSVLASSWEAASPHVVGAIIRSSLALSTGTKAFVAREHKVTWQCQYHCKCKMLKKGKLILHTITNPSLLCILPPPTNKTKCIGQPQ